MGKKSGTAKGYDNRHRGDCQVRDLRRDIPTLVKKILSGDFTSTKLYGINVLHPVTAIDHAIYDPVLKERDILAARLTTLIGKTPEAPKSIISVDATAKQYPQLARDFNAQAFYRLTPKLRQTTKPGDNPDTMTLNPPKAKAITASDGTSKDIEITIEVSSEQDRIAPVSSGFLNNKEKQSLKVSGDAVKDLPRPGGLTSESVKRAREDSSDDKPFAVKPLRTMAASIFEEQDYSTKARSVDEDASVPIETPVELAGVQIQESGEEASKQDTKSKEKQPIPSSKNTMGYWEKLWSKLAPARSLRRFSIL